VQLIYTHKRNSTSVFIRFSPTHQYLIQFKSQVKFITLQTEITTHLPAEQTEQSNLLRQCASLL